MDALTPPDGPMVPVLDLRDGGPLRHAAVDRTRARALRDDCLGAFPPGAGLLVPLGDGLNRRWLRASGSPYVDEIAAMERVLGFSGVWMLNGSYQWACTTLAREEGRAPWLARTLDWPFPGLGRHVTVVRFAGPAGDFFSATWPGFAGVLTAMAPGRFAVCINQAPMRRRSRRPWLRPWDFAANAVAAYGVRHIPADHLLRFACETCGDFAAARTLLAETPVARPVIYTLVGCRPGERCVIERTETEAVVRTDATVVANDWSPARPAWEARMPAVELMRRSFEEAAAINKVREAQLAAHAAPLAESFDWVLPPVLNPYTRVAVAMSPGEGRMRVVGWEADRRGMLPRPVTAVCEVAALARH